MKQQTTQIKHTFTVIALLYDLLRLKFKRYIYIFYIFQVQMHEIHDEVENLRKENKLLAQQLHNEKFE